MANLIYLIPIYLLPFGDLLNAPRAYGFISLSAFVGLINIIRLYPKKCFFIIFFQFFLLLNALFFNQFISDYPIKRGLFSIVWWSLPLISLFQPRLIVSKNSFKKFLSIYFYLTVSISACALVVFFFEKDRPEIFFGEPSWLGLYFYSSLSLFLPLINDQLTQKIKFLRFGFLIILFGAISTSSAHIISFVMSTLIYLVINNNFYKIFKNLFTKLKLNKKLIKFFLLGITFIFLIFILLQIDDNLKYRFDSLRVMLLNSEISNISNIKFTRNLSVLSWLNSGEKALYAIQNSPIFGFGPGSTGFFDFKSKFYEAVVMAGDGVAEINHLDAYSLFFRGIIEYGGIFVTLIILNFRKYFIFFNKASIENKSLFLMSFTLFIGALLKQTSLPQSIVFLSFYIPLLKIAK